MLSRYFYHCASIVTVIFVSTFAVDADGRLGHSLTPDKQGDSQVNKIDVFGRTLYKSYWKAPGQQKKKKKKKKKKKTKPKVANWNERSWQETKPKTLAKTKASKKKHHKESRSEGEEGWHGVMSMLDRF